MSDPHGEISDVLVVGGGPVGLVAAIEARLAGMTVVLVEPRGGPIDKACGEGLMPGALPLLARLGVAPEGQPLRGISYRQGSQVVTHRFSGAGGGLGVRRTTLHNALAARAAELGVVTVAGKVIGIQTDENVVVARVENSTAQFSARYLLACDGLHSTIAQLTGLTITPRHDGAPAGRSEAGGNAGRRVAGKRGRSEATRKRYGVRQHFAREPWSDTVEVYYGRRAEFYVTPVAPAVVGLAMLAQRGVDFDEALADIPLLAARLAGAEPVSSRRGAGPFRRRTRARTAGRVLLVGDSSGYVDAITGEGLRLGFGQAAAAVRCIVVGDPAAYERAWRRETRNFRVLTTGLVLLATSPLRGSIVPLAARFPTLFGAVVERLAR